MSIKRVRYNSNDISQLRINGDIIYEHITPTYTPVDCLESTGTQYIDTGVVANGIEIKYQYTNYLSSNGYNSCFGARKDGRFGLAIYQNSFHIMPDGYNMKSIDYLQHILKMGIVYNNTANLDDSIYYQMQKTQSTDYASIPCYLFCENLPNYVTNSAVKIFYCKLYYGTELVRDFIPVLDENGVPCMFDRVTETFFYNVGKGEFIYSLNGSSIQYERPKLDYLESTGTQYIDTGVVVNGVDIKFQYNYTPSYDNSAFGARDQGAYNRFGLIICRDSHNNDMFHIMPPGYDLAIADGDVHTLTYGSKFNWTATLDGTYTYNLSSSGVSSRSTYLFRENDQYTVRTGSLKIFYCKLYSGNNLVRDFTPCINNGEPCMYDAVSGDYFYNEGTGTFLYEEEDE